MAELPVDTTYEHTAFPDPGTFCVPPLQFCAADGEQLDAPTATSARKYVPCLAPVFFKIIPDFTLCSWSHTHHAQQQRASITHPPHSPRTHSVHWMRTVSP